MREKSATVHPALQHRCPFCKADPGEACRTRNSGREQDCPHSRRIALTRPIEDRMPAPQVDALCCECGQQRTVSSDYSRHRDPNSSHSVEGKAFGWRYTQTLKCAECGQPTRHAILRPDDCRWRDHDEQMQRIALGGSKVVGEIEYSDEYVQRLRREYRELFPRNPYLRHRRWNADAEKAWDDGTKRVIALCGEPMDVKVDPRQADKYNEQRQRVDGYLIAEELSDTEYEDPETGLWWLDMECVDCLRVSNGHHQAGLRKRLEWFLARFACSPELIPEPHVGELLEYLEKLYDDAKKGDG